MAPMLDDRSASERSKTLQPVLRPGPARKVTARSSRASSRVRVSIDKSSRRLPSNLNNERRSISRGRPPRSASGAILSIAQRPAPKAGGSQIQAAGSSKPRQPSGLRKAYLRIFGPTLSHKEQLEIVRSQEQVSALQFALQEASLKVATRDERINKCEKEIKRLRRITRAMEVDQGIATLIPDPVDITTNLPTDMDDRIALLRKQALKIHELESKLRTIETENSRKQPAVLDRPHFESQLKTLQRELELTRKVSGQKEVVLLPSDTDSTLTDSSQKRINKKLKLQLQKSQDAYAALKESIVAQTDRQAVAMEPRMPAADFSFSTSNKGKAPQIEANAARRRSARVAGHDGVTDSTQMPKNAEFNVQQARLADMNADLEASKLALAESITAREKLEAKLRSSKRLLRKALIEAEKTNGIKSPTPLDGAPRIVHDLAAANEQIQQLTRSMRETSEARESMKARLDSAQLELARLTAVVEKRDTSTEELERHLTNLETAWNSTDGLQQRSRLSAEVRITELSAQVEKHATMKVELLSIAGELDQLQAEVEAIKGLKGEVKILRKENKRLSEQVLRSSLMGAYEITIIEETGQVDAHQTMDDGSGGQTHRDSHLISSNQEGGTLSRYLDSNRYSAVELSTAIVQTHQNFVNIRVHEAVKDRLEKAEGRILSLQEENRILLDAKKESSLALAQMRGSLADGVSTNQSDARSSGVESQLQALRKQLEEQHHMRDDLELKLVGFRHAHEDLKALQTEYARAVSKLQEFGQAKVELEAAQESIILMRRELQDSDSLKLEVQSLQRDVEAKQALVRELNLRDNKSLEELEVHKATMQTLEEQLENNKVEIQRLGLVDQELRSAKGDLIKLQMQLHTQSVQLDAQKQELAGAKSMAGELRFQVEQHETNDQQRSSRISRLEGLVDTLRASEASLRDSLNETQARYSKLQDTKQEEIAELRARLERSEPAVVALTGLEASKAELDAALHDLQRTIDLEREQAESKTARLNTQMAEEHRRAEMLAKENQEMRDRLQQVEKLKTQVAEGKPRIIPVEYTRDQSNPASPIKLAQLSQELGMHESMRRPSFDSPISERPVSSGERPMSASSIRSDDSDAYKKRLAAANWALQEAKVTNKQLLDRLGRRDRRDQDTSESLRKSRLALDRAQQDLALLSTLKTQKAASDARMHELESEILRLNDLLSKRKASPARSPPRARLDATTLAKEKAELQDELKSTQAALEKHLEESDTMHEALQTQLSAFDALSEQLEEMSRELQISRENEADLRALVNKYEQDDRSISSDENEDASVPDEDGEETSARRARNFALQLESIQEEDEGGEWARSNYDHRDRVTPDDTSSISSSTVSIDADTRQLEEDMMGGMYVDAGEGSSAGPSPIKRKSRPTIDLRRAKNPLEHQLEEETPRSSVFSPAASSSHRSYQASRTDADPFLSPQSDQLSFNSASSRPESSTGSVQESDIDSKQSTTRRVPEQVSSRPKPVSSRLADRVMHYETLSQRVERKRREELANEEAS